MILIIVFFLSKKWIIVYFKFHMLCREQCWSLLACGMGQKDLVIYLPGSFIQKPWINWCIFSLIQLFLLEINIIWLWSLASPWLLHITFLIIWWSPTIQRQLDKILWGDKETDSFKHFSWLGLDKTALLAFLERWIVCSFYFTLLWLFV